MFTVFFVSAVVHEYIIALALGFFYPVLLLMFGGVGGNDRETRCLETWGFFFI